MVLRMSENRDPVVYPRVTHRNPCPMSLYFLNWVKYA